MMAEKPVAVLALFSSAQALLDAVPQVRERRLGKLEAYTPYPVHGLDEALGLKRSPLGAMVFGMGVLGAFLALAFQWWTSAVDYPVRIGGKAFFSWQAFVPIMFEVMVLLAAFTAGLGMLFLLNRLPWFGHPILHTKAITSITRDRFALAIEADGGELDVEAAREALATAGGETVEVVHAYAAPEGKRTVLPLREVAGVLAGCLVAGVVTFYGIRLFPVLPPMGQMEVQSKAVAFRQMRSPVAGTVARGHLPLPVADAGEAGAVLVNPLPRTRELLARGRATYQRFCELCHGPLATGTTTLSEAYQAQPANLQSASIRNYADGRLFYVVSYGFNNMPGYAVDLSIDDRWAVVHYVRALQRSQNAREEDLP
ncbi:MAG: DUF3341 domain-containing protein [bacterium]|nr:DUF3341 domain-containing protein [bacterium]